MPTLSNLLSRLVRSALPAVAGAVALAPAAFRRAPTPRAWRAQRPLTIEDRLAAATFGAHAVDLAARTLPGGGLAFRTVGPVLVALGGPAARGQRQTRRPAWRLPSPGCPAP